MLTLDGSVNILLCKVIANAHNYKSDGYQNPFNPLSEDLGSLGTARL
jgi:hypothetical protein